MKILAVALDYHDYTSAIIDEFIAMGHEVSVHDIMPRGLFMKAARVVNPAYWQHLLRQHHLEILASEKGKIYDAVFFLQVHQMDLDVLKAFRSEFSKARFILYNWDSINNHDYRQHLPYFDAAFTFDRGDSVDQGIYYLPLFCTRRWQTLFNDQIPSENVYFIGNVVNPARYSALRAFERYAEAMNLPFEYFAACTPPVMFKMIRGGQWPSGLSLGEISQAKLVGMLDRSSSVFDFANHQQTGYTMRVMENLCMGRKIISNNRHLLDESFYSPDRIHVFDGLDFSGVDDFVRRPIANVGEKFEQFHVQAFARNLLQAPS